jgi:hypothetical protein
MLVRARGWTHDLCVEHASNCYCARCAHEVTPVGAWRGFVWAKRGWYAGIIAIAALAPIIMSEITLLLPLAVAFGMAAGPVHSLAAQRPTCSDCGAELK